ncbi:MULTISPECIES: FimV/HubP family polar landmark protein [Dyella]|uniref:Fimbrial protein FimV n=2 Tax=Dyella TaxID=231454 RepID=A0A4R0YVQ3_9GAMM|nr:MULTISPECIES: FimV/HubP family polar landmark protein [Dyella]TBR38883.1 fimbrial protein FimV [Dyella terrae]TCI13525.1 fimbrial protein FimV [Dyella soli]
MNRTLKLSVLLALALGSAQAAALDLGQIQIKSALGQPLVAEIPVRPESPAELQNLSARLASSDEFARAGLGGAPTIPLQFTVVDAAGGGKAIRITSSVPVNDPYLDLLVEVDNATGKSVREFTILLDPPNSPAAAPATKAPVASSGKPKRAAAPAPAASSTPATTTEAPAAPKPAAKPTRQVAAAGGEFGPVERGQTLSGIAKEVAPQGVDINQMLLALKQANPDAFYRDNINALKSGAVLRVPSREDAQAMAVAAAVEEVRHQNSDWRSGAARTPTAVADAGTRAAASTAPSSTKHESADRLALVPAKEGGQGGEGKGGKSDKAAVAGMHQDLLRSQEALASLEQQGNELKSRLKDLEDINAKNARLLSLKDNEIAELQRKLAEARKSAGAPAEPAAKPSDATKATPAVAAAPKPAEASKAADTAQTPAVAKSTDVGPTLAVTPAGASSVPAHASTAAAAQPVASKPAAPAKPAPKKAASAPAPAAEEPWYTQTWALAAGGGAVVLLLLGLLSRRRKSGAAATGASASASSLADRFGASPAVGHVDPDQDELLDQLAEHPDDIGLHLELVSLYYSRRDVDHFEAAAEAMHAHIASPDQPEWQDVVHMGEDLVPGHPLFAGGAPVPPPIPPQNDDEHAALDDFDLGRYVENQESDLPPIPAAPVPNKKVSEYHFDFDLTPRPLTSSSYTAEPTAETAGEKAPESVSSWQFAELDEEDAPADEPSFHSDAGTHLHDDGQFSDDPVDTKLDLARAYLDMGDPDGARAMLEEVMHEGTQMQKEVARKLLENIH